MIEPSQSTGYLHSRQQQQQQGKIRRIKKSQSIHGISTTYQRHQPLQQQQQQQLFQPSFQQQSLFYTPSPTQQQPVLHRPYRPSFDDISTDKFMASTTTTTSVVDDFTVNNMNMDFSFLNSLNIDHFSSRTEGHPLL
jgi:hypothetical protein